VLAEVDFGTAPISVSTFSSTLDIIQVGIHLIPYSAAIVGRIWFFGRNQIPGPCVQYPGLHGGGALDDASTPGTPGDSIAASAHGGTYSHVAVAGERWCGEKGAAAGTAAAAARRRRATSTRGAFTPPRSAPLIAPVDGRPTGCRNRSRRAGTITRGSSRSRSTPVDAARGRRTQLGAVGGGRGAGTVRAL